MALLGQGTVPVGIDYSQMGADAWRLAQSNVGAISGAMGAVGDAIKDRREKKDKIKVSEDVGNALMKLFPETQSAIAPILETLKDEERPLSQRAELGDQLYNMVNLGIEKTRNLALMDLEKSRLGLDTRRVDLAEAAFRQEGQSAVAAAMSENDIKKNEALSRYAAIKEMEAPLVGQLPKMDTSEDLITKYLEQDKGEQALNAVEAYESARIKQMEPLLGPQQGPKLAKIGGTDASGKPIEQDVFVTPQGGLFDIQGQPLNAPAINDGMVLPPRDDVPQEQERRIPPMPQTQLGVRPVRSVTQTPEQIQEIRRGEMGDKRLVEIQTSAAALSGNLGKLRETQALLQKVRTGFGAEAITAAKRMLPGVDVSDEEQLQTLLGDQVMARVGETKGAVSEKEMDLFQQYSANFGKTTEGNKRIVAFAIKAAERAKKIDAVITAGLESGKSPFEIQREVKAIQDAEPLESTLGDTPTTSEDRAARLRELRKRAGQ